MTLNLGFTYSVIIVPLWDVSHTLFKLSLLQYGLKSREENDTIFLNISHDKFQPNQF